MAAPVEPQVWAMLIQVGVLIVTALGVFFGVRYADQKADRKRDEDHARQLALAREQLVRAQVTQTRLDQLTKETQEKVATVAAAGEVERDQDPVERANEAIRQALRRAGAGPGTGGSGK